MTAVLLTIDRILRYTVDYDNDRLNVQIRSSSFNPDSFDLTRHGTVRAYGSGTSSLEPVRLPFYHLHKEGWYERRICWFPELMDAIEKCQQRKLCSIWKR